MICRTKCKRCYYVLHSDQELKIYAWQWKHYLLILLPMQFKDVLSYQNIYKLINSFKVIIQTREVKSAIVHFLKNAEDEDDLNNMLQTAAYVWGHQWKSKKKLTFLKNVYNLFCLTNIRNVQFLFFLNVFFFPFFPPTFYSCKRSFNHQHIN